VAVPQIKTKMEKSLDATILLMETLNNLLNINITIKPATNATYKEHETFMNEHKNMNKNSRYYYNDGQLIYINGNKYSLENMNYYVTQINYIKNNKIKLLGEFKKNKDRILIPVNADKPNEKVSAETLITSYMEIIVMPILLMNTLKKTHITQLITEIQQIMKIFMETIAQIVQEETNAKNGLTEKPSGEASGEENIGKNMKNIVSSTYKKISNELDLNIFSRFGITGAVLIIISLIIIVISLWFFLKNK
jgi:hypothetical protein